jgi:hypothetical protein
LHVPFAIGPGLLKQARSPRQADSPISSGPEEAHASVPRQEFSPTLPLRSRQANSPRQASLPISPWFPTQAKRPRQADSPTEPVLNWHAFPSWNPVEMQVPLAIVPALPSHAWGPWQALSPTGPSLRVHAANPWQLRFPTLPELLKHASSPMQAPSPTAPVLPAHARRGMHESSPAGATEGRSRRTAARVSSAPVQGRNQADGRSLLVGEHPIAVDLLLVDPAGAVERGANERRLIGVYCGITSWRACGPPCHRSRALFPSSP